ncbi:MAG: acyl carrier protein phosphodiesterase [Desulfuromonadales bacterium]
MNYLVHLYLAGSDPELRLGGMMGDFVKGPLDDRYPPGIVAGLRLHRAIDSLAATSPFCRASRQRLHPRFGHTRAVLVDIFYDHFLAVHWDEYHPQPLHDFAAEVYRLLATNRDLLPDGLAQIAPRMTELDWLTSYRDRASVNIALQRIATRLSRPTALGEGVVELERCGEELREDFRGFMVEGEELASRFQTRPGRTSPSSG